MGFEPTTSSLPRKRSTPELRRPVPFTGRRFMSGDQVRTGDRKLKAAVAQLSHPLIFREQDSNLRRYTPTELQSVPFGRSGISKVYCAICEIELQIYRIFLFTRNSKKRRVLVSEFIFLLNCVSQFSITPFKNVSFFIFDNLFS